MQTRTQSGVIARTSRRLERIRFAQFGSVFFSNDDRPSLSLRRFVFLPTFYAQLDMLSIGRSDASVVRAGYSALAARERALRVCLHESSVVKRKTS